MENEMGASNNNTSTEDNDCSEKQEKQNQRQQKPPQAPRTGSKRRPTLASLANLGQTLTALSAMNAVSLNNEHDGNGMSIKILKLNALLPKAYYSRGDAAITGEGSKVPFAMSEEDSLGAMREHFRRRLTQEERECFLALRTEEQQELAQKYFSVQQATNSMQSQPLRFRVLHSSLSDDLQRRILSKLERQSNLMSGDVVKFSSWVETMLSLPLNKHSLPNDMQPITMLQNAMDTMNKTCHGHIHTKRVFLERMFRWWQKPYAPQRADTSDFCSDACRHWCRHAAFFFQSTVSKTTSAHVHVQLDAALCEPDPSQRRALLLCCTCLAGRHAHTPVSGPNDLSNLRVVAPGQQQH